MFGDRLSKNASLTSLSPEEATRNRERLVLSLMERQPLLKYDDQEQTETVEVETVKEVVETVKVETVKEVLETVKEVLETVEVELIVAVKIQQEEGGTTKKDWSKLTVPALKDVLRVRNLKLSGRKADLVLRLIASDLEIRKSENRINAKPTS